ncbi:cyanophycin synthetase [Clostridium formicaceticum]|uniref:Cyanophycin synthetase n=1 Tax=Clostridium formicaceticum TaxID=1497 RepID=A0AAC9RIY4_9CLOT|nr:cyanophycin synthetase [Clostridium formicaceticum]AOY76049.1 cyanophycin synthetase [Clostridium formicaceticum]ARE86409.1 Cyanophycin synthetase [Clostridium formicaceticum]
MKLLRTKVYYGRNIYAHFPVIRVDIDLKNYVNIPTCDIEGFNEGLLAVLPGLKEHKCSIGTTGGFVKRLNRGTYLAHVMEHMTLEIQNLLGYDLKFGKARYLENDSVYYIVFSYENPTAGEEAALLAFDIIQSLLHKKSINFEKRLQQIKQKITSNTLGPSTASIVEEAKKRNIPVMRIGGESLIQLGYGKYAKKIQATITENTNCIAVDIACDKELTKNILRTYGIPVPDGGVVESYEASKSIIKEIGFPVVVKPYNGNQGKGVSLNLNSMKEVKKAFSIAKKYSNKVLIEKYILGRHYRATVVGEKVIAVSERIAAHVIGNGINTIKELIEIENLNPLRGEGHEKPLTKITIDDVMLLLLKKTGKTLEEIPQKGEIIYLRENDNLSTGGIAIDVTENIHPDNVKLAINATRAIGLDVAGIDITVKDIGAPIVEEGGAVIEVNACPGIRMHHYPSQGKSRNVAKSILDTLFPEKQPCAIPIVSVTGTNGKTTTTRMLAKIFKESGLLVGMTSTGGVFVQEKQIIQGDTTGPKSAQAVLMDKRVELAVLETARGGIVNKGLGYDLADIGVITNIGDDHLGIDGINTLEEMADVKSLVVEAVKKDGYAVLNAEDNYTNRVLERVKCNIIYFAKDPSNECLQTHMKNGGKAVYLKDKTIYIFDGKKEMEVIEVEKIPATFGGVLEHNIENGMAAIAAAHAYNIDIKIINVALSQFYTDTINNPGRFNVFDVKNFKVIIDYGHNIDGYNKVLEALNKIKSTRLIGVVGVPGDRTDINILKVGEVSGKYFDYAYIKEDKNLRGRKAGEVAGLLKKGCNLGGLNEYSMEIELCEIKALEKAMEKAEAGDMIVVFYEEYAPLVEAIERFENKIDTMNPAVSDLKIVKVGP